MRGKEIRDAIDYISSNECTFKVQKSVTFHFGTNNIRNWSGRNSDDLIDSMLDDYNELIKKAKEKFPTAKIYLSNILRRSDKYPSRFNRNKGMHIDDMNQTIDIVNEEIKSRVRKERRVYYISHQELDENLQTRYDGIHLDDVGIELFVEDIKNQAISWTSNTRFVT